MGVDVAVHTDFARWQALSRGLRDAPPELKRELYRGLNRAVKEPRAEIKTGLAGYVPDRYAGTLGPALRINVSRSAAAGIRVTAQAKGKTKPRHVGALDRGLLRHKLFGRGTGRGGRSLWYSQRVRPGFFSDPMRRSGPAVRREIKKVLDDLAAKIAV